MINSDWIRWRSVGVRCDLVHRLNKREAIDDLDLTFIIEDNVSGCQLAYCYVRVHL